MLEKLVVDNYLLIDHVEFDGHQGISVFVGETGSGKSLFIEALGIILGNKFSLAHIGTFREMTNMSAVFSVDESDFEIHNWFKEQQFSFPDEIIITRVFQKNGKSITRLNGEIVPVQIVRSLGEMLVDIHSQFDTQRLLNNTVQHESVDNQVDSKLRGEYAQAFNTYKNIAKKHEQFLLNKDKQQDLDYLYFQKEELESFQTYDENTIMLLEEKYKRLKIQLQNSQYIEASIQILGDDGVRPYLHQLNKNLAYLDNAENKFSEIYKTIMLQVDELDYQLNQLIQDEDEVLQFNQIEEELQRVYRLQQKHGDDLAKAYTDVVNQIQQLEEYDTYLQQLQNEMNSAENTARKIAIKLDDARDEVIQNIEAKIKSYFSQLHLENVQFKIGRKTYSDLTAFGLSTIQFQVASNNQETYQPLAKVVSGGELSRIMLALKVVMLEKTQTLMIFDEIDSGVSGKVAASIADVLYQLADVHQVFLITHSSLVAVIGKQFYEISKQIRDDKQYETMIEKVEDTKINYLLAQLISQQSPSESAIKQIQHLREKYE
ncbi:MAG: AAA family ATPase [Culicoidibacterales bacterium]